MSSGQLGTFLRQLRRLVGPRDGGLSDAQLLGRFVAQRDEAAFEVLVWRHGLMVWSVCRRLLGHSQDAEDAFQATFLSLVRKAGSIGKREALGSWLYKVAYRASLRARSQAAKRAIREQTGLDWPATAPPRPLDDWDLQPVLDEEIQRLPERYRTAFILCQLEGKTNEEAARQLGCPAGTVSSRLSWARERLRTRLTRRGLALSASGLAVTLNTKIASAAIPAQVVESTLETARSFTAGPAGAEVISGQVADLTHGVLKAMAITKLKIAGTILLGITILGAGSGTVAYRALAAVQEETAGGADSQPASQRTRRAEESPRPLANGGKDREKNTKHSSVARNRRVLRWSILFDTREGEDYAKQLHFFGAFLAVPEGPEKFLVVRDLMKRPVEGKREDLTKIQAIYWVETDPSSVERLAKTLGIEKPPYLVVFFPQHVEDELLRKEWAYTGRSEEDIEETRFQVKPTRTGYDLNVVAQSLKSGAPRVPLLPEADRNEEELRQARREVERLRQEVDSLKKAIQKGQYAQGIRELDTAWEIDSLKKSIQKEPAASRESLTLVVQAQNEGSNRGAIRQIVVRLGKEETTITKLDSLGDFLKLIRQISADKLTLEADPQLRYVAVKEIMDLCKQDGFQHIDASILSDKPDPGPGKEP